jgi:D-3-phosphoglycerate dehydrogenase / 2-oxoglutarate reductase
MKLPDDEKILIGPSSFGDENPEPLRSLEALGCEIVNNPFRRKLKKEELLDLLGRGVTGIIAGLETLDRPVLEKSSLKVISRCGAGMSNVDLDAARVLGIRVYNTPFGPTRAVAELTVGCLLSLIRKVPQMDRRLHLGQWDKRMGRQLKGMKVLVVGYGRIGKAVAKLIDAFEAEVVVCDPLVPASEVAYAHAGLHEALPEADVVTLHLSGAELLLGPREFALMKPGVFILNGARGELVDEETLTGALESGLVAGAWMDTFAVEPYSGPLVNFEQVILTPHVGSYTAEGRLQMELDAVENLALGFREWERKA